MYRYLSRKKGLCLLFTVLLVLSCTGGPFFSLVMSALIDCAGKSVEELFATLLGSVAYVVFYILLAVFYRFVKTRILTEARYFLKKDIFTGIMNRSVAEFDAGSSAEYINELSNHMNLFETVYFGNIIGVFECLLSFGAATAICIMVQPLMLILMIALAFFTMGVTRLAAKPLERSMKYFTDRMEEYTSEIKDDFEGFRLIYSFGILPHILRKHEKKNREMEDAKRISTNCRILCAWAGQFVGLLSTVLVMAMAAYFSLKGMFSAGMVIAFGHLIGNIVSPITQIPSIVADFRAAKPLQTRFEKLLREKEERGTEYLPVLEKGITLEHLSFGYGEDREVLHQLSFPFRVGGHYAITGRSGSGKSTLLSLLLGYYSDYSGEIYFDDIELRQLKRECMGELVGVVSQDTFLFNDTIYNNIALFDERYAPEEVKSALERAGLKELIDSLPEGLDTIVSENGKNFSGGEKQRFSLARALLRKKKILLLDEFTANLDAGTAEEIEERVHGMKDCLIIAVTHRTEPKILRRYDRVLALQ